MKTPRKTILYKDEYDMFYIRGETYYHAIKEKDGWYEKLSCEKEFDDFISDVIRKESNSNGGLWGIW